MTEKFDLYDVLGILVPGILTICVSTLCFPVIAAAVSVLKFPDAFSVLALTALAIFLGHAIQALSSMAEPFLYRTWGGRFSERALVSGLGDRYLPLDAGKRIRAKLAAKVGADASDRSLFLYALQLAETSANARVTKFNGLFAYHRALLVLTIVSSVIFAASTKWGAVATWPLKLRITVFVVAVLFLLLMWHRTRQRGIYYVREVLTTAERLLDAAPANASLPTTRA